MEKILAPLFTGVLAALFMNFIWNGTGAECYLAFLIVSGTSSILVKVGK